MSGKVQSAKQRKANEAFARKEDQKRGKPTRQTKNKASIKRTTSQKAAIALIGVLIFGGLLYELIKIFA